MCVISRQHDTFGAAGNNGWQVHQGSGLRRCCIRGGGGFVRPCSPEMLCCLCLSEGLCLSVSLIGVLQPVKWRCTAGRRAIIFTAPCRDALACQIFSALQQAGAGQQYHQDSLGSSVDWPVSLPWLTYNTSDASSLLEATDIQSRYPSLALDPQVLQVTATLEVYDP